MMKNIKKIVFLFLIGFTGVVPVAFPQISHGGVPAPYKDLSAIPVLDLTGRLRPLDELAAAEQPEKKGILRFARAVEVDISPATGGRWDKLSGGQRVWRIRVLYKQARSLGLIFGKFRLAPGEKVFVYDPAGRQVLGAFTADNNKPWGSLAVQPLAGSSLIIEYRVPDKSGPRGELALTRVSVGYLDIFRQAGSKDDRFGMSGPCNVDINCPAGDGWQKEKNAVVRIFINNNELLSGVLMNTAINNAAPYILSAGHGIESQEDAENSVFVFGYESPYCDGPDGSVTKSISGSDLLARIDSLDFTLVKMSRVPPFTYYPYFAGWNASDDIPVPPVVTIHHPMGDVKKITIDNDDPVSADYDVYDKGTFWEILQWETGTTEPGSSGAPLFDAHHRVVGTLSGGDAHCGNSVRDYFQKLSAEWDDYPDSSQQLKHWLDPKDFGFLFWNGNDPYLGAAKTCDTLTNFEQDERIMLDPYGGADAGYWTGHNAGRTIMYAEKYENSMYISMTGVYIKPALVMYDSPFDHITVKIWYGTSKPEDLIVQKDVPMSHFVDSVWNFVDFDTIVPVEGNFFAGFEIYYDNDVGEPLTDQFAVFQTEPRSSYGVNTAYYYQNGLWSAFSGTPNHSVFISLAISPVMCQEIPSLSVRTPHTSPARATLLLFPNPAVDEVTLVPEDGLLTGGTLRIMDLAGKVLIQRDYHPWQGRLTVPLSSLSPGIYVVVLETPGKTYRNRLILQKR